jgi:hypothetical protein
MHENICMWFLPAHAVFTCTRFISSRAFSIHEGDTMTKRAITPHIIFSYNVPNDQPFPPQRKIDKKVQVTGTTGSDHSLVNIVTVPVDIPDTDIATFLWKIGGEYVSEGSAIRQDPLAENRIKRGRFKANATYFLGQHDDARLSAYLEDARYSRRG